LNVGHALPTVAQALIYITIVQVQFETLTLLILSAVGGSWFGASIVAGLPKRSIQRGMGMALVVAAALMVMTALNRFPGGGAALELAGTKLVVACAITFVLGALMTLGIGAYALTAAVAAIAPSALVLITARAAAGIGAAMVFGTSLAFVSLVYPEEERGRAIGTVVAMLVVGFAAGTLAGGALTDFVSWRALFVPVVVIAGAVAWYSARHVEVECALARGRSYDRTGAALWAGSLLALMVGLSTLPAWTGLLLAVTGAVGIALFVRLEQRLADPLLDLGLLRRPCFGLGNLSVLLFYAGTFAPGLLLSLYLQQIRGYGAGPAALLLVLSPIVMAVLSRPAGRAADRIDPRAVAAAGAVVAGASLAILTVLSSGISIWAVVVALVLI
jgi:MFS family permease